MRKNSYYYRADRPLAFDVKDKLVRHFENELRLIKRRDQIKRELLKKNDFMKSRAYLQIADYRDEIDLCMLSRFLENNRF